MTSNDSSREPCVGDMPESKGLSHKLHDYIGYNHMSASPTACPLRGYGRSGTQNDRHGEAVILSTGMHIRAQWTCRRRCRYVVMAAGNRALWSCASVKGLDMALDMCSGMCLGMCLGMYLDMCLDTRVGMCLDMCLDTCLDTCLGTRLNMCLENVLWDLWTVGSAPHPRNAARSRRSVAASPTILRRCAPTASPIGPSSAPSPARAARHASRERRSVFDVKFTRTRIQRRQWQADAAHTADSSAASTRRRSSLSCNMRVFLTCV